MRAVILLSLIILPAVYALSVDSLPVHGDSPDLYGDVAVYVRDGIVYSFDLETGTEVRIARGDNPAIFGFTVVFEQKEIKDVNADGDSNDVVVYAADARTGDARPLAVGRKPSIYFETVVFETPEQDEDLDLNNDGDLDDVVLRYYDLGDDRLFNTKLVGGSPAVDDGVVVFETGEDGRDLNGDGDARDVVIRTFTFDGTNANTHVVGSNPRISEGWAVFVSDEYEDLNGDGDLSDRVVQVMDVWSGKVVSTGFEGENPSIHDGLVVFSHEGDLFSFSIDSASVSNLQLNGFNPFIFDDLILFSKADGGFYIARGGDVDDDGISDFVDNCAAVRNEDQLDGDHDGIGNVCDSLEEGHKKAGPSFRSDVRDKNVSRDEIVDGSGPEKSGIFFWILALLLVACLVYYLHPRQRRRRRKSFGF